MIDKVPFEFYLGGTFFVQSLAFTLFTFIMFCHYDTHHFKVLENEEAKYFSLEDTSRLKWKARRLLREQRGRKIQFFRRRPKKFSWSRARGKRSAWNGNRRLLTSYYNHASGKASSETKISDS